MKRHSGYTFACTVLFLVFIFSLTLWPGLASAGLEPQGESLGAGPMLILHAGQMNGGSPLQVLAPELILQTAETQTANINVTYKGEWPAEAKIALEYAKNIWQSQLSSPVAIVLVASWEDLSKYGAGVLGAASAADYWRDFPGAPFPGTWYPVALVNTLAGKDLNDTDGEDLDGDGQDVDPEIKASFNSRFTYNGQSGWYFGIDGKVDSQHYDFVSVALHEIGHGLGFSGSMVVSGTSGSWGSASNSGVLPPYYPFIFDRFAINAAGQSLIDSNLFPNPSTTLGLELTSSNLFFNSQRAKAANNGVPPKLFAPNPWKQGSSFSHLDEITFPKGSGNALMTPNLSNGEAVHVPGPIAMGMLYDMGWPAPPPVPVITPKAYLPLLAKQGTAGPAASSTR